MFSFSINKVNFEEEIGEGAHGAVYAYQQKNPGEEKYAVKRITASKIDVILSSVQEIVLGFSCDHPHVLPIRGYHIAYEKTTKLWNIFIKMSRMETSLKKQIEEYIKEGKTFKEEEIVKYFYALTLGLRYLHNKSIAHRDIKPDNILIDNQGQIKIADIGTGKLIENEENDYLSCAVGIPLYTAPEVLAQASKIKKKGLFKADIWSLGVIMAELCVPKLRLVNTNATGQANEANLAQILKGLEGRYKKVLLDLIASLLRADPNERQSLEELQRILEENYSDILAVKSNYEFGVMKQDMDNKIAVMKQENEKLKMELLEIQEHNREIKTLLEASLVDIENNMTPMKEENQRLKIQLVEMQEHFRELMTQSEVLSIDAENKLVRMKEKNEKLKTKLLKLQQENIKQVKPQSEVSPVEENSKKSGLVQQSPPLSEEKVIKKDGIFKWFRKDSKQQPEEKKSEEKMLEFRDHIGNVTCLEILSTGELASGAHDKTIKLWNIKTGAFIKTLNGHKEWISCLKLLPKGDLASSSWDDTIKIWNTKKGLCIITLPGHAYSVSSLEILSTGELISSAYDKKLKLWDLKTGLSETKYQYEFSSTPLCLKSLPTGEVACGLWDNTIMILDVKGSKLPFSLMGHENPVTSLALLLTGELASSSEDMSIRIWNIKTRTCRMTLLGHSSKINCVLVLPKGELASGSADQTIKIWDTKSGICTKTFQGSASIKCLNLSPSGELISGTDNIIKMWSLKDEAQCKP